MKTFIAQAALFLMVAASVSAQSADHPSQGQGYFFIAPIVSNTRYDVLNPAYYGVVFPFGQPLPADLYINEVGGVNTGFGGEIISKGGLGLGAEAGYAGPDWSFGGGGAVGVGSIDASYHFLSQKNGKRIEPFFAGGYSLYYGDRTATQNGFNIGGGLNFWVAKHAALRLEVRDHDHINHFHSQFTRFVAFRFGVTFR
jgi:opacity protein-like surface antigen